MNGKHDHTTTVELWSSVVRVQDSQAYRKMDVTRERMEQHQIKGCQHWRPNKPTLNTVHTLKTVILGSNSIKAAKAWAMEGCQNFLLGMIKVLISNVTFFQLRTLQKTCEL